MICRLKSYCTPQDFVFNWVIYQHLQNGRVHIKSWISGLGKMEDMGILVLISIRLCLPDWLITNVSSLHAFTLPARP